MTDVTEHVGVKREVLTPQNLYKVATGGGDISEGLPEENNGQLMGLRRLDAVVSEQDGFVLGVGEVGFQEESKIARVGVYIDTDVNIDLNASFNVEARESDSKYSFTASGELNLSNDTERNSIQLTTGAGYSNVTPETDNWDLNWQVTVGLGVESFGNENDIKASLRGDAEWTKGTTSIFTSVALDSVSDVKLGVRQDVLTIPSVTFQGLPLTPDTVYVEAGLETENFDRPEPFVGVGFAFKID